MSEQYMVYVSSNTSWSNCPYLPVEIVPAGTKTIPGDWLLNIEQAKLEDVPAFQEELTGVLERHYVTTKHEGIYLS